MGKLIFISIYRMSPNSRGKMGELLMKLIRLSECFLDVTINSAVIAEYFPYGAMWPGEIVVEFGYE